MTVDTELCELISRFQGGDLAAGWEFVNQYKIQAIIRSRLSVYSRHFCTVVTEDVEDVHHSLLLRLYQILPSFELPETFNDGRVLSYFSRRIAGEADFILRKVTQMRQAYDEETSKNYLQKFIFNWSDTFDYDDKYEQGADASVIQSSESNREERVVDQILSSIKIDSRDYIWLRCHQLKLRGLTWPQVSEEIGYGQTDYGWLKENTDRFLTRVRDVLIRIGHQVDYAVCGIYVEPTVVSITVAFKNSGKKICWSHEYSDYADLDRVELKLGDLFRANQITYVVMNECALTEAEVIVLRFLHKRSAFVETVDLKQFLVLEESIERRQGVPRTDVEIKSILLTEVKFAYVDEVNRQASRRNRDKIEIDPTDTQSN